MYMYIYVCMHTNVYIYISYTYIHVYIYIYTIVYINILCTQYKHRESLDLAPVFELRRLASDVRKLYPCPGGWSLATDGDAMLEELQLGGRSDGRDGKIMGKTQVPSGKS